MLHQAPMQRPKNENVILFLQREIGWVTKRRRVADVKSGLRLGEHGSKGLSECHYAGHCDGLLEDRSMREAYQIFLGKISGGPVQKKGIKGRLLYYTANTVSLYAIENTRSSIHIQKHQRRWTDMGCIICFRTGI